MRNKAETIKIATLAYWRFIRHHPAGAIECKNADVLTITRSRMLTETEVKTNIADMQREINTKRYKHLRMSRQLPSLYPRAHYFYFAVPKDLVEKALRVINERYPYAGLLQFTDGTFSVYEPQNITVIKSAKRFNRPKVEMKEFQEIAYGISNTALRYMNKFLANEAPTVREKL